MGWYTGEIRCDGVNDRGQIVISTFNMETPLTYGGLRSFESDDNYKVVIDDEIPEVTLYDGEAQNKYVFHIYNGSQWGLDDEQWLGNEINRHL